MSIITIQSIVKNLRKTFKKYPRTKGCCFRNKNQYEVVDYKTHINKIAFCCTIGALRLSYRGHKTTAIDILQEKLNLLYKNGLNIAYWSDSIDDDEYEKDLQKLEKM